MKKTICFALTILLSFGLIIICSADSWNDSGKLSVQDILNDLRYSEFFAKNPIAKVTDQYILLEDGGYVIPAENPVIHPNQVEQLYPYELYTEDVSSETAEILNVIYNYKEQLIRLAFEGSWCLSSEDMIYPHMVGVIPQLRELEVRDDAGTALLLEYLHTPILVDDSIGDFEKYKAYVLDFLLTRSVYWEKLTPTEKQALIEEKNRKNVVRDRYISDGYEDWLLYPGWALPSEAIAEAFSTSLHRSSLTSFVVLYTRDGTQFTAIQYSTDLTQSVIDRLINQFETYGNVLLGNPTMMYNCHSYAWYSTNIETNKYWIDDPVYYIDDSHTIHITSGSVKSGYKIVYYNENNVPVHSGIVDSVDGDEITVHSKWGRAGLYEHSYDNVPSAYKAYDQFTRVKYFDYRPHTYTIQSINTLRHKCTCSICEYEYVESHLWNIGKTKCLVCGFNVEGSTIDCLTENTAHE